MNGHMHNLINISPTDRKLLAALSRNARASITTLAQDLGVSRATAQASLDKLVAGNVITRFTIDIDPSENVDVIRAISLIEVKGNMASMVVQALRKSPEVTRVSSTNGSWDLVVEIETSSLAEFDRLLRIIRELAGILNSETSLLLKTLS